MSSRAELSDCLACMATIAAIYPGQFPDETRRKWAAMLHQDGCAVEDLVKAVDDLGRTKRRPRYADLWECVMAARDERWQRERMRPPERQLAAPERRPLEGEEATRAMLAAKVLMVETRDRARNGQAGPPGNGRWAQLKNLPLEELKRLADDAEKRSRILDGPARPRGRQEQPKRKPQPTHVGKVAGDLLGGKVPAEQRRPEVPPDPEPEHEDDDDFAF